ncbi:MAG: response regulator [Bacteroidetes bacterium]|nr:response regulator [Bacteroidota bacterium]
MAFNILVVDDEQDVEFLFKQRFRKPIREGTINIDFATSGEAALSYLNEPSHTDIALILSDINMPGMTGFELLEKIKTEHPELKVMMVTAYGDEAHTQKAKQLGADDLLAKPIDFKKLEEKLMGYR